MRSKHMNMRKGLLLGGLLMLSACGKAAVPAADTGNTKMPDTTEISQTMESPEAAVIAAVTGPDQDAFTTAALWFQTAGELSDRDHGKLWGRELYAPLLIVDRDTRQVISDTPDPEGHLTANGGFYTGVYPDDRGIANTSVEFGGEHYAMVVRQFMPEDQKEAGQLMIHEMFHRHQEELGLTGQSGTAYDNSHLEEMDARISLQLEWAALEQALLSEGETRREAVSHALAFRGQRREVYDKAADENCFEIHEGMAEYTGYRAAYEEETAVAEIIGSGGFFRENSFVRNYAYYSGPLYGYLLDAVSGDWRKAVSYDTDLGVLLSAAYEVEPAGVTEMIRDLYGYPEIFAVELDRKEKKDQQTAEYLELYTRQPVLWLPTNEKRYSFVPALVQPITGVGTVYPAAELYDDWGALKAGEASFAFIDDDSYALVSAVGLELTDTGARGNGWELTLENGFEMIRKENGDYVVFPVSAGS